MKEIRVQHGQGLVSTFGLLLGLTTVCLFFFALAPSGFSTLANLRALALHFAIVGTAALGATLVVVCGGMDLSAGPAMALSATVIAWLLNSGGAGALPAAFAGIAAAGLVGTANGFMASRLRVAPIVITLGTMLIATGLAGGIAGDARFPAGVAATHLPAAGSVWDWPVFVWIALGLAAPVACLLRYTVMGRHIRAVGSSEPTARLCGVRVAEVKILVYTMGGVFAGVAGLMQFHSPSAGPRVMAAGSLDIIAAVIIGRGSLTGGDGSVLGTLIGAAIMTVIRNGCSYLGVPESAQQVLSGAIIIAVAGLDRLRHRA